MPQKLQPVSEAAQNTLRSTIVELGLPDAATKFGIDPMTALKAAVGLPVSAGTRALVAAHITA